MNNQDRARKRLDPAVQYGEPRRVVADTALTKAEKVDVLLDWRQDLIDLQNASSENMPDQTGDANVGGCLQAVTDTLVALGHESS